MKTRERVELMGQVVTVKRELYRVTDRQGSGSDLTIRREWSALDVKPRAGWVVGFRTLQNGTREGGYYDDPARLRVESTTPCVLVAYWTTMEPVRVPLDGFELGGEPHGPRSWGDPESRWYRENVAYQRVVMRRWPRDERGRWVAWKSMTDEQRAQARAIPDPPLCGD